VTKADQATFDEFKDGLNKWLDSFKENIDLKLGHMDERIDALTKVSTRKPLMTKERGAWSALLVGGVILKLLENAGWIAI
jgi:hypothetical protein